MGVEDWGPIRGYVYRVLTALGLAAVLYGILTGDEVKVWLEVAAAVLALGNGLAAANRPVHD